MRLSGGMKCSKPQANENERANSFSRLMAVRCPFSVAISIIVCSRVIQIPGCPNLYIEFGTLKSNRDIFSELVKMLGLGGRPCCLDPP
jgi:hypothetical protein